MLKQALEPIWHEKADTARKALNRISLTLMHAAALGLSVDLQATDKARALLGKQKHQATHIPSMPHQEVPAFFGWLRTKEMMAAKALQFLILTADRTSEVRLFDIEEVEDGIWKIPAERAKTGQLHRVPLSKQGQDRSLLPCLQTMTAMFSSPVDPTRCLTWRCQH